MFIVQEDTS